MKNLTGKNGKLLDAELENLPPRIWVEQQEKKAGLNSPLFTKYYARSDKQKALVGRILFMIDNMSTIYAGPIKHGQWIENKLSRMKWIPDENDGITAEETTIEDMTEQKCSICQL